MCRDNTKSPHGKYYKVKWDGNAETFKEYKGNILSHCRQNNMGYIMNPHFMAFDMVGERFDSVRCAIKLPSIAGITIGTP
jgi:hypothetical protein